MFASEILTDLSETIGGCIDARAYRRLTDGVKMLADKQLIDALISEIDVCVCGNFVTLPPEVETIMAVTVNRFPSLLRSSWFTWHLNGPGDEGGTPCGFTDILGNNFCTYRDPDRAVKLAVKIYDANDANKMFHVFGYAENGDRIYSTGSDGKKYDGFLVPTIYGTLAPNAQIASIVKIERILKEASNDFFDLFAVDPVTNIVISQIGRYRPDETTPRYNRIRVQADSEVRVKFRRRNFEITRSSDWINCENRLALIHAVKAVVLGLDGKANESVAHEAIATRLLKEEDLANTPGGISPIQVLDGSTSGPCAGLFYS